MAIPPLRRIKLQRDQLMREQRELLAERPDLENRLPDESGSAFISVFRFLKPALQPGDTATREQRVAVAQELGWRAIASGAVAAIEASDEAWFRVELNGVPVTLPRYTLMTMRHCLHVDQAGHLRLFVETDHWQRMRALIEPGTLFLDVGAATGAMTVPYSMTVPDGAKIVAFEPSRRAMRHLQATLARNGGSSRVTLFAAAVSDAQGEAEFFEQPEDPTGEVPFLPESSRLGQRDDAFLSKAEAYSVDVITLDGLAEKLNFADHSRIVIKIDVEGYEVEVLKGATKLLTENSNVFISTDIHNKPGTTALTGPDVTSFLSSIGYKIETHGHVIFAQKGN
ncbi:Methyltransferase, FkbM family [Bosea sp. 62]|nr:MULTISPECIES: FkbM family methyltransferase [unclassified Bosea (in: a-proteobacteria)]CAD5293712.1 Methyltransferase, FkbM family [Bosea sp. 46]VXB09941.1 Methyltransferase, FkbM family [Bosea sp. 125]VXC93332.1 Methyltransferase, FkbM family [Bosea sp. 62]CAD5299435.1 Methyltransferase, FkbM family [Bosea sp. 7B]VVT62194.1 Methyltransferase, FkbM family [Bosea sp. EC-HK365B]